MSEFETGAFNPEGTQAISASTLGRVLNTAARFTKEGQPQTAGSWRNSRFSDAVKENRIKLETLVGRAERYHVENPDLTTHVAAVTFTEAAGATNPLLDGARGVAMIDIAMVSRTDEKDPTWVCADTDITDAGEITYIILVQSSPHSSTEGAAILEDEFERIGLPVVIERGVSEAKDNAEVQKTFFEGKLGEQHAQRFLAAMEQFTLDKEARQEGNQE